MDNVESNEKDDIGSSLNNSGTDIVLKKNLENDLVQDEKSNNLLIVEANIQLAENTDVNDEENNVKLEQELTKKGKKGKVKENANKKDLKFKLG